MANDGKMLDTIKVGFGLQPDYNPFDAEILMHINSVLSTLNQLGVGPQEGIIADANTPWSALLEEDKRLENVKSYVFLRVKMLFDANAMTQHVIAAYQKMIEELEWRITVTTDPMIPQLQPDLSEDDPVLLDAGEI
jgi:hypothetical protein